MLNTGRPTNFWASPPSELFETMVHGNCDRARHWASADVDGELSTFERVLLANHVAHCSACKEFRASVRGLTTVLRATPRERFEVVLIGRIRRRATLRLAPAVAAMAVAAVGLGSILASSEIRTRSVASAAQPVVSSAIDAIDLKTVNARATKAVREHRSVLGGGPVLQDR